MEALRIESPANARIKALVRLHTARERRKSGLFPVEGTRELERALAAGFMPQEVYCCEELFPAPETQRAVLAQAREGGVPIYACARPAFEKASLREGPDGLLATVPTPQHSLADLDLPADAFLLALERVEKPGNLGALLRTADGAGCHAVVVGDPVCEVFNPGVIRASQGAVFRLPVVAAEGPAVLAWLRERGIALLATTPRATRLHWDCDLTGPLAIALGSEADGLSEEWLTAADIQTRLPMCGMSDSLNVSASGAIVLYEALRQRHPSCT